ncbi:MAG: S66 peptidase family protein [Candidatus Nanoarchaeia archaeon]|jgi:muramoyltetrapeptide carboxypeptidase LdcA involved in peptidoglycan recycling
MIPPKLKKGDLVRIVSPSHSISTISDDSIKLAVKNLEKLGLKVDFSANCFELNCFESSSIKSRADDINNAFDDKKVKAILCARGGFNSNQLLPYLDYNSIKKNPKIFCGYSDITALNNGIFAKTGLFTYAGINFSTFRKSHCQDYNLEYFKKCLMSPDSYEVKPSKKYFEYLQKSAIKNKGYFVLREGESTGEIIGENLCTFNLLQGTDYMPDLKGKIIFLEEENISSKDTIYMFDRELASLCQQRNFGKIKGLVIGRFQKATGMTNEKLKEIIDSKKELPKNIPVIAGLDFAHTIPRFTYPIGGTCKIIAKKGRASLEILKH